MIIGIILTIWVLLFCVIVAVDYTPCNDSFKKAFMFLSSFIMAALVVSLIWTPYLLKGIQ